jgi:hypothetical protein
MVGDYTFVASETTPGPTAVPSTESVYFTIQINVTFATLFPPEAVADTTAWLLSEYTTVPAWNRVVGLRRSSVYRLLLILVSLRVTR